MMSSRYSRSTRRRSLALRRRVVEAHQRLAGLDEIAFAHQHVADDAAFEVLHLLVLARGDERAGGDDGAVERRQRRPQAEAADPRREDGQADHRRPAQAVGHVPLPGVERCAMPPSCRRSAGLGGREPADWRCAAAARRDAAPCSGARTPPARPLRSTSTRSTELSSAGRCVMTTTVTPFCLGAPHRLAQRLLADARRDWSSARRARSPPDRRTARGRARCAASGRPTAARRPPAAPSRSRAAGGRSCRARRRRPPPRRPSRRGDRCACGRRSP